MTILDYLIKTPEKSNSETSTVIWMHGLGAEASNFSNAPERLIHHAHELENLRFIFPNAPIRPVTINQNMPCRAWYDIYSLKHLDHEDLEGLNASRRAIHELIQNEINRGTPSTQIFLAGFSQGGAMALHAGITYPLPLAGILALSAYLPMPKRIAEIAEPANKQTPFFQAHGHVDNVLPIMAGLLSRDILNAAGYSVTWKDYDMGHEISEAEWADIAKWIATSLRSSP